jgi:hypothetical protein
MDIKSVLSSLQGISDAFTKKKEEESQNSAPEKKVWLVTVDRSAVVEMSGTWRYVPVESNLG